MKRFVIAVLVCCFLVGLCGCGGNIDHVTVVPYHSNIYTAADINAAMEAAKLSFYFIFPNCTMTEIAYAGDQRTQEEAANRELPPGEELIVLLSAFDVADSGADGGLTPGATYHNYHWILTRHNGGLWILSAYGYG